MGFLWLLLSGLAQAGYGIAGGYTSSCKQERLDSYHKWWFSDRSAEAYQEHMKEEERIRLKYGDRQYYK